jgi:hypothetical protein
MNRALRARHQHAAGHAGAQPGPAGPTAAPVGWTWSAGSARSPRPARSPTPTPRCRNDRVDPTTAPGLTVLASRQPAAGDQRQVQSGRFLTAAPRSSPPWSSARSAATRLGIAKMTARAARPAGLHRRPLVHRHRHPRQTPLSPDIDRSVLVGWDAARTQLGFDGHPTVIYVKARSRHRGGPRRPAPDDLPRTARHGAGQPPVRRPRRQTRHRDDLLRALPRPGRGRPAGRRDRRGQHHGHLGPGTPPGDRAAPGPGRQPGPDPQPVPHRVRGPVLPRRPGRHRPRRPGDRRLRHLPGLAAR